MSRVVPASYVTTDEAIKELLNDDQEWSKLSAAIEAATGKAKFKAYLEASKAQDALTQRIYDAAANGDLDPLALKQATNGNWTELRLPRLYWQSLPGKVAIFRGMVVRADELGVDEHDIALGFERAAWHAWLHARDVGRSQKESAPRRTYAAKASQAEHDKWFEKYRDECVAAGKSPNVNEDEAAGKAADALGVRFDRDRARESRRRLKPNDWGSTGKRRGKAA